MSCPICGGDAPLLLVHSGWQYNRCKQCGHAFLAEPPSEEALREFYNTSHSTDWNTRTFDLLEAYRRNPDAVRRYYHRDRCRHLGQVLRDDNARSRTILDIGCGSGVFLATMRDIGFHVTGQDLSAKATDIGREQLGIDLTNCPLSRITDRFDLITCYDVIEHWIDPKELVCEMRRLCNANGTVVIRTPNHASWLRAVTGPQWLWYMPPAHVHLFTPASLRKLLEDSGFTLTRMRTGASSYLYFIAYYLNRRLVAGERLNLDMPRWKEAAIFTLDRLLRLLALPLLIPARLCKADALIEVQVKLK